MLYEVAENYKKRFIPFSIYPTADDREAWEAVDDEWKKKAVKEGETYLHFSYPSLSAVDFMDFSKTGNRVRYEEKYFARRLALDALVLAECVENQGRFMEDIVNGIFFICEESAWQLPAHNAYKRDAVQYILPDSAAPILDLFACETGAVLGTALYLLERKFESISPFISKRIRNELRSRIFEPYLNRYFWWMGNVKEPLNNWTIWCTQNVLLAAFLTEKNGELWRRIFKKACKSADYFLDGYGEDGCCDEGAQYYRHAGLCLFNTIELLNAVTGNCFAFLYDEDKIKNIASYIWNVHIEDKYYVNFADCSPVAGRAGVREFLFAMRTGNENMAAFAASDFLAGKSETLTLSSENNLYYRLQNAFAVRELKKYAGSAPKAAFPPDIYYPSAGIFLVRDKTLTLAVKAGDNADSHNHNDCGSFTVFKCGEPLLIDVGVESYTKKTFSPQRYEIWTMQSAYHNLPTIDGYMQKDGEEYRAKEVSWQLTDSAGEIEMDLRSAYPAEANLCFYKRKASFIKNNEIRILDSFAFVTEKQSGGARHEVILNFMTYEKPVLNEKQGELFFAVGSLGSLAIKGAIFEKTETIPITDERLKNAWKHDIYRIQARAVKETVEIRIF